MKKLPFRFRRRIPSSGFKIEYEYDMDRINDEEHLRKVFAHTDLPPRKEHKKIPFIMKTVKNDIAYLSDIVLDNPLLFLEFAALKDENDFLNFANTNGLLLPNTHNSLVEGEKISFWKDQVNLMRAVIKMYALVFSNATMKLDAITEVSPSNTPLTKKAFNPLREKRNNKITLPAPPANITPLGNSISHAPGNGMGYTMHQCHNPEIFKRYQKIGGVGFPAKVFVQKRINEQIKKYPSVPQLLLSDDNVLKFYIVPLSLLGGLWFQLLDFINSGKRIEQRFCKQCGEPLPIKISPRSSWKELCLKCSGRQRKKEYDERQRLKKGGPKNAK